MNIYSNWFIYLFLLIFPVILYLFSEKKKSPNKRVKKNSPEVILFGLPWCRQTQLQKRLISDEILKNIKIKDMRETNIQFNESPSWKFDNKIISGILTEDIVKKKINYHEKTKI